MSGQLFVVIEPAGHTRIAEEGITVQWNAQDLWEKRLLLDSSRFWSAPGSPFLGNRCLQFNPEWFKDPDKINHLVDESQWTFAGGVTHTAEYINHKDPSVAPPPGDAWMGITVPASVTGEPMAVNFYEDAWSGDPGTSALTKTSITTALSRAKGARLPGFIGAPNQMRVIAATRSAVALGKTPYLRLSSHPNPDEMIIFGWSNYAVALTGKAIYVLQTTDNQQNWRLISSTDSLRNSYAKPTTERELYRQTWTMGDPFFLDITMHDFGVIEVGVNELMLAGRSQLHMVTVKNDKHGGLRGPVPSPLTPAGKFWIACSQDRQLFAQIERCAFDESNQIEWPNASGTSPDPAIPYSFDLGPGYSPSTAVQAFFDGVVSHGPNGTFTDIHNAHGDVIGVQYSNPDTGELAETVLLDEHAVEFPSDGTRYRGYLHIRLRPSTDKELTPQFLQAIFRFPPKFVPRSRYLTGSELMIPMTSTPGVRGWAKIRGSSSKLEPDAKVLNVTLYDNATNPPPILPGPVTLLQPYEGRSSFPIEIRQDRDGDGIPELIVAQYWVERFERADDVWQYDSSGATPSIRVSTYQIHCKGLAHRLKRPWAYLEALSAPLQAGSLQHTEAVRQTVQSAGFDTSSASVLRVEDDSGQPALKRILPGAGESATNTAGMKKRKNSYDPEFGQLKIDYLHTVATVFSGWYFWEMLNGVFRYESDVIQHIRDYGSPPSPQFVFHPDHADAQAHGTSRNMVYLTEPPPKPLTLPVQVNAVRLTCKGQDAGEVHAIVSIDWDSVRGNPAVGGTTYENFDGDLKCATVEVTMAVDDASAARAALALRNRWSLRLELLTWKVPLLPWDCIAEIPFGSSLACDVGQQARVMLYGDYEIVHTEYEAESYVEQYSTFTGWKFPKKRADYLSAG